MKIIYGDLFYGIAILDNEEELNQHGELMYYKETLELDDEMICTLKNGKYLSKVGDDWQIVVKYKSSIK